MRVAQFATALSIVAKFDFDKLANARIIAVRVYFHSGISRNAKHV
jgi:hypothetical protein